MSKTNFISATWPAPSHVRAFTTTREGGVSRPPYESWNLASHVGDLHQNVVANRARLSTPGPVTWLEQVHGTQVIELPIRALNQLPQADACFTRAKGVPCAVLTADCLPVFVTDSAASVVGIAHAGWRGLGAGVIEALLLALAEPPDSLLVYLGPAIGPQAFEVGVETRDFFVNPHPEDAAAFQSAGPSKWLADLYLLARQRLRRAGVQRIYGGEYCTYTQSDLFFSYRREGVTGRMASLIWLE